jgi:hypothetical protein
MLTITRLGTLVALALHMISGQIVTDHLDHVWTTQLSPLIKEPSGWMEGRHDTVAVAFSTDGNRVAVTVTHDERAAFNTHLLIIDVQSPETNVREFDLVGTCGAYLSWNEKGDAILVCGRLVRLEDGKNCDVVDWSIPPLSRQGARIGAFWLDSLHVVRGSGQIFDLACKESGNWPVGAGWRIIATAEPQGWVVLAKVPNPVRHPGDPPLKIVCQYSIADRDSHRALSGWPSKKAQCGMAIVLAAGAETLCFSLGDGTITNAKLHCLAVEGGKEILVPKRIRGYELVQAGVASARIVGDRWIHERFVWESPPILQRRTIFDLRSGDQISSWKPRVQNTTNPLTTIPPYHCALSPSGEFVAESGDDSLELYRITP